MGHAGTYVLDNIDAAVLLTTCLFWKHHLDYQLWNIQAFKLLAPRTEKPPLKNAVLIHPYVLYDILKIILPSLSTWPDHCQRRGR